MDKDTAKVLTNGFLLQHRMHVRIMAIFVTLAEQMSVGKERKAILDELEQLIDVMNENKDFIDKLNAFAFSEETDVE